MQVDIELAFTDCTSQALRHLALWNFISTPEAGQESQSTMDT